MELCGQISVWCSPVHLSHNCGLSVSHLCWKVVVRNDVPTFSVGVGAKSEKCIVSPYTHCFRGYWLRQFKLSLITVMGEGGGTYYCTDSCILRRQSCAEGPAQNILAL